MKTTLCLTLTLLTAAMTTTNSAKCESPNSHEYNDPYRGENLDRIAFPIGGIGAGMVCLEGTGAISHVSVRHSMQFFNEPCTFAAISVAKGNGHVAKVLEGPVPKWKIFGAPDTGNGGAGKSYGLPRFDEAEFSARFPFGTVRLNDAEIPLETEIVGWSPFVPGNSDDSSLPVGAMEYRFKNNTSESVEAVFSFHAKNFMATGDKGDTILPIENGFLLFQPGNEEHPENDGGFACFVDGDNTVIDHCWFKGGWWDAMTLVWRNVANGKSVANPPADGPCPGASLYRPMTINPGETEVIRLRLVWYVPKSTLRIGEEPAGAAFTSQPSKGATKRQQPVTGFVGNGLVNTFDPSGDAATGTLTSPLFRITHDYIQFLLGGGGHKDKTCIQLLVGEKVVRTSRGKNREELEWYTWDVSDLKDKQARVRIVDQETVAWGHVNVDQITLTNRKWDNTDQLMQSKDNWGTDVVVLQDFEAGNYGEWIAEGPQATCSRTCCSKSKYHVPWYAGKFDSINSVVKYWRSNYDNLRKKSALFRDTFYDTTLPAEVIEAVAANLTILKSPTILRQTDGRLWCFEGCCDSRGCCHGSCTHVWNYAQAICHLFPELERSLRKTEFFESQDDRGHQIFRSNLPIRPAAHTFYAAADGQLGGIMKVYREWRISGDNEWLRNIWPQVQQSLDYCIKTWDPRGHGVLEEPHHNTYDIEYWGPDGHCSSFYLGALSAAVEMGKSVGADVSRYSGLLEKGRRYLETKLYNGEYFFQKVQTEGLDAEFHPLRASHNGPGYSEIVELLNKQGPKYQYGNGCLSDGVMGFWMARVCGLDRQIVDRAKEVSNLKAIHRYNVRQDLSDHANPQRPTFAVGKDGGLLLCTWPKGDAPALPFVYSDEVWTGIEYQAASHMMMHGLVDKGLEIVRLCRDRYDGRIRNPFNEYECGHWYARAMSSYALLQGLTGVRYDAVDKTLYVDSRIGTDFRTFISTEKGFGTTGLKKGRPFLEVVQGSIAVDQVIVSGKKMVIERTD